MSFFDKILPNLNSCCFCIPLKTGCYIIAILSFLKLPLSIYGWLSTETDTSGLAVDIVATIIAVSLAILLLVGVIKDSSVLLEIWLYTQLVSMVLYIIMSIVWLSMWVTSGQTFVEGLKLDLRLSISCMIAVLVTYYTMTVVNSYRQEIMPLILIFAANVKKLLPVIMQGTVIVLSVVNTVINPPPPVIVVLNTTTLVNNIIQQQQNIEQLRANDVLGANTAFRTSQLNYYEDSEIKGFEDTHVMIFIGFGFLMSFLKKYSYSALGLSLLLAAMSVQLALICQTFFNMTGVNIITKRSLVEADIMAATVLITFGALLGFTSPGQLLLIAVVEVIVGCTNMYLIRVVFKAADRGGAMAIHMFGALFGIGASVALNIIRWPAAEQIPRLRPEAGQVTSPLPEAGQVTSPLPEAGQVTSPLPEAGQVTSPRPEAGQVTSPQPEAGQVTPPLPEARQVTSPQPEAGQVTSPMALPSYFSDITAMIGTLFLWVYWPSFNAVLCRTSWEYEVTVIHSYISLAAAVVTTFSVSELVTKDSKLDMMHVQRSTLAGGVAVGSFANMIVTPSAFMIIGMLAAVVSTLGYKYIMPRLAKLGVLDTCGVMHVHGLPGVLSGLLSILITYLADNAKYGEELAKQIIPHGGGMNQALAQLYALLTTTAIALAAGLATGFVLKLLPSLKDEEKYIDDTIWKLPE